MEGVPEASNGVKTPSEIAKAESAKRPAHHITGNYTVVPCLVGRSVD